MTQNFTHLDSPDSNIRSSRAALKDELANRLAFDDHRVFKRLDLDLVSPQLVASCAATFKTDQRLLEAKYELQNISTVASRKKIVELEADEENLSHAHEAHIRKMLKVDEKKMYSPLTTIFRYVESFEDPSGTQPKNSFRSTDSTLLKSDASTWGFPKGSPDFVVFEGSASTPQPEHRGALWRKTLGFCKIKPTPQQGPKGAKPKSVKPIVCQAAGYARLHLSARPFHLFSVGLLIFGSRFCVAIFDRAGILFSPIHDMWEDIEIFIRVIRSLTCLLIPTKLGQDPTVTCLPELQHKLRLNEIKRLGRETPETENFPTFVIKANGRLWYTVGLPIWTSVSLLGRGTSIWLVQENGVSPVYVLKNTWRSASRLSETSIYESVQGRHPALAKLHQGGDVRFPGDSENQSITAYTLRGSPSTNDVKGGDVGLHRLLLESRGRPLWEYISEKELLQGIRAALSAHQFLCDQGIIHRDISAGNIMLSAKVEPEPGAEGFLMDLEFALLKSSSLNITKTNIPPVRLPGGGMTAPAVRSHITFGPDVLHGAAMTGTAQFMAEPLLEAVIKHKPVVHNPEHDIESFIYVLAYTVTRRAVLDSDSGNLDVDTRTLLHKFFHANFGRMSFVNILMTRGGAGPVKIPDLLPEVFSEPISKLFASLATALFSTKCYTPTALDHESILAFIDTAIAELSV